MTALGGFAAVVMMTGCWGTGPSATDGGPVVEPAVPVTPGVQPGAGTPPAPTPAEPGPDPVVTAANCEDLDDGGAVAGPDCVTATITCGQRVIGHTGGGTQRFDRFLYQQHQCTPQYHDYEKGHERAYLLEIPAGDMHADVWLDTPCVDLDLAAFRLPPGTTCPTKDTFITQCDMWPDPGTERDHVRLVSQGGSRWLIVVEGKDGAEGLFGLSVDCAEGL
jgi:hypothetical protein